METLGAARAATVVCGAAASLSQTNEERYSSVFRLDRVRPSVVADGIAEAQVRFPSVPLVFCETRPLAEEWTYRFLGAALHEVATDRHAGEVMACLTDAGSPPPGVG